MANNKITVHFEAKNNKQLENAIKNLSKAQNSLNKTVVQSKPKMKELDKDNSMPDKVQNNLFVGSSTELQKLLKKHAQE